MVPPTSEQIAAIGRILSDVNRPLKERFRALFTLKNLASDEAVEAIAAAFSDKSALLKHELAYCLGQMGRASAIPILTSVLEDTSREAIVRHEAAEALGALGDPELLPILERFCDDPEAAVADTCQIAVRRVKWLHDGKAGAKSEADQLSANPYASVDPAPPAAEKEVSKLREALLDEKLHLFDRYRAMFALRNMGTEQSILALADGLECGNALFRHEVAFVLGQIQSPVSVDALIKCLRKQEEADMVRHECAEALGSIASKEVIQELSQYLGSEQPDVLRESCIVALDFAEYNLSPDQFQYANSLSQIDA